MEITNFENFETQNKYKHRTTVKKKGSLWNIKKLEIKIQLIKN